MNASELIELSLENVSAKVEDLTPFVYERFFSRHPEAEALFPGDVGEMVKGHMLMGLLETVTELASGKVYPDSIHRWVREHSGYEATAPMFPSMLQCLHESIQELMADDWTEDIGAAWQQTLDELTGHIELALTK